MTKDELEAIQLQGANAHKLGSTELDNPYYREERMPRATGDTIEEWKKKIDAWEYGRSLQSMMS